MSFYIDNKSDDVCLYGEYYKKLRDLIDDRACLLSQEQANQLNIQHFITRNDGDDKPHLNRYYNYLTFPYELGDEVFDGIEADELFLSALRPYLAGEIYLASTEKDRCCVGVCTDLTADVVWAFGVGHMNTPFLIFSQNPDVFALVDYDLPLQIIGHKPHVQVEVPHYDIIQKGFDTVLRRYASYTNMRNLFRTYYDFLLPEDFAY